MKTLVMLMTLAATSAWSLDLSELGKIDYAKGALEAEQNIKVVVQRNLNPEKSSPEERARLAKGLWSAQNSPEGLNPMLKQNKYVDPASLPDYRPMSAFGRR